ncbi:MAG: pyridoxamine 5-phosphate oxidase [Actinomycetia bacterium]|nr:pyridoxamine 5-phosphate oxidase [Actinomycetes bacterium]
MASWGELEARETDLAELGRWFLDANKHKVLATIRADGSPRLSGTEVQFCLGSLYFGTMARAARLTDLRRDHRCALHSSSTDPGPDNDGWDGDTKINGRAIEVTDGTEIKAWADATDQPIDDGQERSFHLFRVEVDELVVTTLNSDRTGLIVDLWNQAGRRQFRR